jgi:hypothetical protein
LLEPVSNLDEFCCWPLPVTLKATITARRGTITNVTINETAQWPQTSAEVQAWIKPQVCSGIQRHGGSTRLL